MSSSPPLQRRPSLVLPWPLARPSEPASPCTDPRRPPCPIETAAPVWNSRQIQNAFQSAVALAGHKHGGRHKILLTRDHFEKVFKMSGRFNSYLWSIQYKTDADKAVNRGVRHDGWVRPGTTGNAAGPRDKSRLEVDQQTGGLTAFRP
ncbi:putative AAA family ATPase [Rosellinia necatrix]|uniref:Putative AAA family ATPase n=1 Tax=Rosellinia necatrix TaxID=77044 RepID=A0A1S8AA50_ROSNE|nr:putative AAA family ATPase [Rosellinia necatrix]